MCAEWNEIASTFATIVSAAFHVQFDVSRRVCLPMRQIVFKRLQSDSNRCKG
jgi:hypothetical protein